MQTEILLVDDKSVKTAASILKSGGVVAIPTETVYGLAADGTNPDAVKEIFKVKGRPSDNPLIAHVHSGYDLTRLVEIEHGYIYDLIKAFMPGPLTLVMKSRGVVCKEAVAGGETLAVRMPSHKGCQALLKEVDIPLVAPSANLSKHTSPVTAEHVYNDLNGLIPLILDGGKCTGGIESTVLDVTEKVPRILRAGLITKEMIIDVVGDCGVAEHKAGDKVKSPGVKYTHYKPKCDTALYNEDQLDLLLKRYSKEKENGRTPYVMCLKHVAEKLGDVNILDLGKTPRDAAANLYLRLLEGEVKADIILAVAMPDERGVSMGVMNRLRKSCG